jgi:hypothetical protein
MPGRAEPLAYSARVNASTQYMTEFDSRLAALDLTLFDSIGPPGWGGDARSLLALHAALRAATREFAYLEIGSYLGSSLQSYVADSRCTAIMSIDPRLATADDDCWGTAHYAENSVEHMLACLRAVPDANLEKLTSYECDASSVEVAKLPARPSVCFIDGEHTRQSALADARFCRGAASRPAVIVFHDRSVVAGAVADFLDDLEKDGASYYAYGLPSHLFVVELGDIRLFRSAEVRRAAGRQRVLWGSLNHAWTPRLVRLTLRAEQETRRLLPSSFRNALRPLVGRPRADEVAAPASSSRPPMR